MYVLLTPNIHSTLFLNRCRHLAEWLHAAEALKDHFAHRSVVHTHVFTSCSHSHITLFLLQVQGWMAACYGGPKRPRGFRVKAPQAYCRRGSYHRAAGSAHAHLHLPVAPGKLVMLKKYVSAYVCSCVCLCACMCVLVCVCVCACVCMCVLHLLFTYPVTHIPTHPPTHRTKSGAPALPLTTRSSRPASPRPQPPALTGASPC